MKKYVMFDHTADLGIEIFGRTKKELFANAAWALNDILWERNGPKAGRGRQKTMTVEGADVADLLINFLRELLYLFCGKALIVGQCQMTQCGNNRSVAKLRVEPYNKEAHLIKTEIKAVTYHGLSVEKTKNGWRARVIFDV